jgi:hypothetical protein
MFRQRKTNVLIHRERETNKIVNCVEKCNKIYLISDFMGLIGGGELFVLRTIKCFQKKH